MSGANPDPTDGPTAQAAATTTAAQRSEHPGSVIGTALCLLLIPLMLVSILRSQGRAVDASELWSSVFESDSLPSGFEFQGASQLATGDRFVLAKRSVEEDGGDNGGVAQKVEPERLCLVFHTDPKKLTGAMTPKRGFRPWEGGARQGFGDDEQDDEDRVTMASGIVEWGPWRATFVHDRVFAKAATSPDGATAGEAGAASEQEAEGEGAADSAATAPGDGAQPGDAAQPDDAAHGSAWKRGPSTDTIRVNLSAGTCYCIFYAIWPEGVEAESAWMSDLLAGLNYRAPSEPATTSAK